MYDPALSGSAIQIDPSSATANPAGPLAGPSPPT